LTTGQLLWRDTWSDFTSLVLVGGQLLGLGGDEQALINPSRTSCEELERRTTLPNEFLNSPAVANGRIYVRDPQSLVCYDASVPVPLKLHADLLRNPNRLVLKISRSNGAAIPEERVPWVSVSRSSDLRLPLERWTPINMELALTNGSLHGEILMPQTGKEWYYTVWE
jgi:hypothetical protein